METTTPNQYRKNKTEKFISYWKKRSGNRKMYALKSALFFSISFTILMTFWDYYDGIISLNKMMVKATIHFTMSFILYFAFNYFYTYKVNEKNYQKYKKEGF